MKLLEGQSRLAKLMRCLQPEPWGLHIVLRAMESELTELRRHAFPRWPAAELKAARKPKGGARGGDEITLALQEVAMFLMWPGPASLEIYENASNRTVIQARVGKRRVIPAVVRDDLRSALIGWARLRKTEREAEEVNALAERAVEDQDALDDPPEVTADKLVAHVMHPDGPPHEDESRSVMARVARGLPLPRCCSTSVRQFAKAILHGDEIHQGWLREAAEAFAEGRELPPPTGRSPHGDGGS